MRHHLFQNSCSVMCQKVKAEWQNWHSSEQPDLSLQCVFMFCGWSQYEGIPWLYFYKTRFYPLQNNQKNLDPSYSMDFDFSIIIEGIAEY